MVEDKPGQKSSLISALREAQQNLADLQAFKSALQKSSAEDLLETGKEGQPNAGLSCMHVICAQGFLRHAQTLIDRAQTLQLQEEVVDVRARDDDIYRTWTPLFFAVVSGPNGHPDIVNLLLKNGAQVNLTDNKGRTALHYASELGQDDTLEMLLGAGADPNVMEKDTGRTAMHLAIENGQFNSVQILWTHSQSGKNGHKLDLIRWDAQGQTVLHYAAVTQGNAALYLKFFVEKCNINVFFKNRQGLTAREYAQKVDRFKFHRVVKLLREMEQKALDYCEMIDEISKKDAVKKTEQQPEGPLEFFSEQKGLSLALATLLGLILFLLEKFVLSGGSSNDL